MRRKWTRPSMMATWEILIPSPVCTSSHSMRSLSNLNSLDYRICCLTSSFQIRNFVEEILMAGWSPAVNLHAIPSTFWKFPLSKIRFERRSASSDRIRRHVSVYVSSRVATSPVRCAWNFKKSVVCHTILLDISQIREILRAMLQRYVEIGYLINQVARSVEIGYLINQVALFV